MAWLVRGSNGALTEAVHTPAPSRRDRAALYEIAAPRRGNTAVRIVTATVRRARRSQRRANGPGEALIVDEAHVAVDHALRFFDRRDVDGRFVVRRVLACDARRL